MIRRTPRSPWTDTLLRYTTLFRYYWRKLYELAGAYSRIRFSPHCWKVLMALAHKGGEARLIPWRFSESEAIAFSNQRLVPILVHDGQVITDSWHIAQHIEGSYPDRDRKSTRLNSSH